MGPLCDLTEAPASPRWHMPHMQVIAEGDKGDLFYIIKDGEAIVYQNTSQGQRKVNHLFKADFFGERALLCDEPRCGGWTNDSSGSIRLSRHGPGRGEGMVCHHCIMAPLHSTHHACGEGRAPGWPSTHPGQGIAAAQFWPPTSPVRPEPPAALVMTRPQSTLSGKTNASMAHTPHMLHCAWASYSKAPLRRGGGPFPLEPHPA